MNIADLILTARWVIPIEPSGECIDNGAVAIRDGKIIAVGNTDDISCSFQAAQTRNFPSHVLMPGLVNAHGHAAMTLFRGIAEDQKLEQWLHQTIWPLEHALVTPEFVQEGTTLACAEMLRGGTTTFVDQYFYSEHLIESLDKIGMRAFLAGPVLNFPMPGCPDGKTAIRKVLSLYDELRKHPRLNACFGPHAPYSVSDELLSSIATFMAETDLRIHMHVHENAQEITDSLRDVGIRPLQRLNNLGLLSPQFMAVHATQLDDADIALLVSNGVHVIHCPESNLKLANGFCPSQKLVEAGINVALGTDGAASNNNLDMFGEMRTATLLGKALSGDPSLAKTAQMLEMATINGARALGLENVCGSLVVGKAADIIAIDLSAPELQPVHNPMAHLIYNASYHHVSDVWVDGQPLLRDGQWLTIDIEQCRARANFWKERVAKIV